jgi:anti-anti-sigma factor
MITATGEFDIGNVSELEEALSHSVANRPNSIVVSMADVRYMDSTAIYALLKFSSVAKSIGPRVIFVKPADGAPRRIWDLIDLSEALEAFESLEEAKAVAFGG